MHVPDGFLSPQITLPAYAVSAPLWAWAARRHFGRAAAESLPVVGSLSVGASVKRAVARRLNEGAGQQGSEGLEAYRAALVLGYATRL